MNEIGEKLRALFQRIPRRHTADNVREMYSILDAYEDVLKEMETDDRYEKQVGRFLKPSTLSGQPSKSRTTPRLLKNQRMCFLMRHLVH